MLIVDARSVGISWQEIGECFNVTAERVRQIHNANMIPAIQRDDPRGPAHIQRKSRLALESDNMRLMTELEWARDWIRIIAATLDIKHERIKDAADVNDVGRSIVEKLGGKA
jgi:hypothetical protein